MSFLNSLLYKISGYLKCKQIKGELGQPYLERYMVARWGKNGENTIFLHRFLDSDSDQGVHDHPWNSKSFIVAGGYMEERLVRDDNCIVGGEIVLKDIKPLTFNTINKDDYHRIILKEKTPAWTLFYHGPRVKKWGFIQCSFSKDKKIEDALFIDFKDPTNIEEKWEIKAKRGKQLSRQEVNYIYNK